MRFKSRIDGFFIVLIVLLFTLNVWVFFMELKSGYDGFRFLGSSILTLLFVLIISFSATCRYYIEDKKVIYKFGPFKGGIEIERIRTIEKDKILWTGIRPATAFNGVVISYNKYDQIYLSPKNEELFIMELMKINPEIKLVQKK